MTPTGCPDADIDAAADQLRDTWPRQNPRTVGAAMVRCPQLHPPNSTVAAMRTFFDDDHVHCAVLVAGDRLLAVVERSDLAGAADDDLAYRHGRVAGRTVRAEVDLDLARDLMLVGSRRRLAVVGKHGVLLGLLCLKRSGDGFCCDDDVRARAAESGGARYEPRRPVALRQTRR